MSAGIFGFTGPYLIYLADIKAPNVNGGSFLAGADRTRDLNTKVVDEANLCTLSSNQFTLLPAKYEYFIQAPAYLVDRHQAVLWNVTDGIDVPNQINTSALALASTPSGDQTNAFVQGVMTLTTTKTFEVRHRCNINETAAGFGFGAASSVSGSGRNSVYTTVQLRAYLS